MSGPGSRYVKFGGGRTGSAKAALRDDDILKVGRDALIRPAVKSAEGNRSGVRAR